MKTFFVSIGLLCLISLIVISSINSKMFFLQLGWIAAGVVVMYLIKKFDWRSVLNYDWVVWGVYVLSNLLVVAAYILAPVVRNTRNWIMIGPVGFQPVELVKIALILVYANFFSRKHVSVASWGTIIKSFMVFAIPAALVLKLPDMGSTLVLFGIWFGFLLVSGLPLRRIALAFFVFAMAGIFSWFFIFKTYQKERILGVFFPDRNKLSYNYQVIQSKIAIGSGGWFGKGYRQGSQIQLGFLSEPSNDFIFASLVEEWGIFGGLLAIGAFITLIFKILKIGEETDRNFEKFICVGVTLVLGSQFLLNAGSAVALFPVVGMTFPLLSYGGSSILAIFTMLALVGTIRSRLSR